MGVFRGGNLAPQRPKANSGKSIVRTQRTALAKSGPGFPQ